MFTVLLALSMPNVECNLAARVQARRAVAAQAGCFGTVAAQAGCNGTVAKTVTFVQQTQGCLSSVQAQGCFGAAVANGCNGYSSYYTVSRGFRNRARVKVSSATTYYQTNAVVVTSVVPAKTVVKKTLPVSTLPTCKVTVYQKVRPVVVKVPRGFSNCPNGFCPVR